MQSASEKVVYFVRHGQSESNVLPIFQAPDSPLTELGMTQARRIAQRASRLPFEALISSPFLRARDTAAQIEKATGKKAEYSDLFIERMHPNELHGRPHDDPEASALWLEFNRSLHTPGLKVGDGESYEELVARADAALRFLEEREESSLLVVTHGYFLRTIVGRVLLGDLLSPDAFLRIQERASTENTALTALRHERGDEDDYFWRLWVYNDHTHLG